MNNSYRPNGARYGGAPQVQSGAYSYGYAESSLSQFSTNPQLVQKQVQYDLAHGQGAMTSAQAGSRNYTNASSQPARAMNRSTSNSPSQYGAHFQVGHNSLHGGGLGQSLLSQYGSDPQAVRARIHNNIQGGTTGSMQSEEPQPRPQTRYTTPTAFGAFNQGTTSMGATSKVPGATDGVTNPQVIRQQISDDIARGSYYY